MANVTFTMDGESAKAVQAWLKLTDAERKAEIAARCAGDETKKVNRATQTLGSRGVASVRGIAMQWVSVGAGVSAAAAGIRAVIADMKELDKISSKATTSLTATIAGAGDLAQAKTIKRSLGGKAMAGTGVGVEEAGGIYGAIRGAAPAASVERVLSLTDAAAGAKRAGFRGAGLTGFATTMGEVSKLAGGRSAGDIGDLAAYIATGQGRYGKKITRGGYKALGGYVASGMGSLEQGIGLMLASVTSAQGSEAFQQLVQNERFASASPAQRAKILGSEKLLSRTFGTQAPGIRAMLARDVTGLAGGAAAAQRKDLFASMQRSALADQAFAEELAIDEEKAKRSRRAVVGDVGTGQRNLRFTGARMEAEGTSAAWRGFTDYAGQMVEVGGEGRSRAFGADAPLREAANDLRQAAAQLNEVSRRLPNPNIHTEGGP